MAFDLLLGRIPQDYARDSGRIPSRLSRAMGLLCLATAGGLLLAPEIQRKREIARHRALLADEWADVTSEIPAVSMAELIQEGR